MLAKHDCQEIQSDSINIPNSLVVHVMQAVEVESVDVRYSLEGCKVSAINRNVTVTEEHLLIPLPQKKNPFSVIVPHRYRFRFYLNGNI